MRDNYDNIDNFIRKMLDRLENETPEQMLKKMEYSSLLSEYLGRLGREVDENYSDIIPIEFEISDAVDLKIKILKDALDKQIPIEKSEFYTFILEGVF